MIAQVGACSATVRAKDLEPDLLVGLPKQMAFKSILYNVKRSNSAYEDALGL